MERYDWNEGWRFTPNFTEGILDVNYPADALENIRIPHTVKTLPFHYCNEKDYQMISGYRKSFFAPASWQGKHILLTFEAVAHEATVYCNGVDVAHHCGGYTAFTVDLSTHLKYGVDNVIAVKCDSNETINVPPFGYVIDYLTYGGIYRKVTLDIKESIYLRDVFVYATADGNFRLYPSIVGESTGCTLHAEIIAPTGEKYAFKGKADAPLYGYIPNAATWHPEHPNLYALNVKLVRDAIASEPPVAAFTLDEMDINLGFRTIDFRADGLYLNGEKIKIRGLNRHQSFAYQGYAMPDSQQVLDAEILKNELACNAVRTSHYPQSQSFIDACDKLGLLVFTEIPGWQYIGDEDWKDIAIQNCREMVLQYRNHPSIFLWGARINESADDDEFYQKTNDVIRRLDPTRPTGGVRCIKNSNCFEDVYTYNDFSHSGKNAGCVAKRSVTSAPKKGYMVTEYNGHMYPTKTSDDALHRQLHAMRHATVLQGIRAHKDIAGSFGWCMFDYNTHKDFGSGDRICYHGVLDMFRNSKVAAAVYASQKPVEKGAVLELSGIMQSGDYAQLPPELWVFTNADEVRLYRNEKYITSFKPDYNGKYGALEHPPILIDDFVGEQLVTDEGFAPAVAADIKECLNASRIYGMNLPTKIKAKAMKYIMLNQLTMQDLTDLHNKYNGNWGVSAVEYRFEAVAGDKVVANIVQTPVEKVSLSAKVLNPVLTDGPTWDCACVQLKAIDQTGALLHYYDEPVCLTVTGPAKLIGPTIVPMRGGLAGTYVASTGKAGSVTLRCEMAGAPAVEVTIEIKV